MFNKGDYIVYGMNGVCMVRDITTMEHISEDKKLFYQLIPLHEEKNVIYTPVDNEKVIMRPILTKKEALDLIDEIPEIARIQEANYKVREQQFKNAMKSCDCRQWVKVLKTSYLRKQERIQNGKKVTAADEKYLKAAENHLYEELSVAMEVKPEDVVEVIAQRVGIRIK